MTAAETVEALRTLLDDSQDWYNDLGILCDVLTEAQRGFVRFAFQKDIEEILLPLYRTTYLKDTREFQVNDYIEEYAINMADPKGDDYMFVKSCRIFIPKHDSMIVGGVNHTNLRYSLLAEYMPEWKFKQYNYLSQTYGDPSDNIDDIYYTVVRFPQRVTLFSQLLYGVNFTHYLPEQQCKLTYIALPRRFNLDLNDDSLDQGLVIPRRFIPIVIGIAAEMLNTIDVGEMQRGAASSMQAGERITLEGLPYAAS